MNIRRNVLMSAIWLFLLVFLHPFPASSAPLDNWHVRNSAPGGYTLNAVAYGNGMFVAVGSQGTILSSPDGTNWTTRSSGTTAFLGSVAYGNGVFVVAGPATLTSSDGVQWTSNAAGWWNWVRFGNGKFVAYEYPGPAGIFESTDGITWDYRPSADEIISGFFMDIVLQNGTYVVVGHVGTFEISPLPAREAIYASPDGTNWTLTHQSGGSLNGSPFWINGINYGNGNFVAVSSAGRVFHSTDGYGWTFAQTASADWLYSVAYGGRTFVAVGNNGMILQSDSLTEAVGVPTLSEWGMILIVLLCGLAAIRFLQTTSR